MWLRRILKSILVLAIIGLPLLVYSEKNYLYDQWRLRNYQPSSEVKNLASQDTMTPAATHIFYVNHPALEGNVQAFRQDCTVEEQTIVLGCYHPGESGIYIYNVSDSRLAGVQQVTAAHEMLHAAYERLSLKDRNYVDGLLLDYYQHNLHDQRIIDTMNSYKKTEPNDVVNEMHSVFGTEISNLPAPLENYYKRYFTNRAAITTYSANYEDEFSTREDQAKKIESQMNDLLSRIRSEDSALKSEISSINAQRAQLESLRSSGQNSTYNSMVDSFNAQVDDYNSKVAVYQSDIATYNRLLGQYNQIAGDLRSLYNSINTSYSQTTGQ